MNAKGICESCGHHSFRWPEICGDCLKDEQLKTADALAKAIEATDHLGHGITDVSCSVCDALAAYEKARGMI